MKKKKIKQQKNRSYKSLVAMIIASMLICSVLLPSLKVFADNGNWNESTSVMGGSGTYTSAGTIQDVFHVQKVNGKYPVLSADTMQTYYTGSGTLSVNGDNGSSFFTSQSNLDELFENTTGRGFFVPESVTAQGNTFSIAQNGGYFLCYYEPNTATSQQTIMNYMFQSAGSMAILNYDGDYLTVYSDQPIYYICTESTAYYGTVSHVYIGLVQTQDEYGFYKYSFGTYNQIVFSNMPVYLPSTDGASGFTDMTDFSFSNDNTNFNNLVREGIVDDPFNGGGDEMQEYEYNMYCSVSENFNFSDAKLDLRLPTREVISIAYNNYIKQNLEKYFLEVTYDFKMNGSVEYFSAPDFNFSKTFSRTMEMRLSDFQNGQKDMLFMAICSGMKDGNGESYDSWMDYFAKKTGHNYLTDNLNFCWPYYPEHYDDEHKTSAEDIIWGSPNTFEVTIKLKYNFQEETKTTTTMYHKVYNLFDGTGDLQRNDLSTNLNPPVDENNQPVYLPSENGSEQAGGNMPSMLQTGGSVEVSTGGVYNSFKDLATSIGYGGNATIQSGAVQNEQTAYGGTIESGAVVVQTGGGGFQITNQDWNEYGTLVETMAHDMTDISTDNGVMSVMQVCKNAYEVFPAKIWAIIGIGVGGSVTLALWRKGTHCH